jgi:hypothetical protein
MLIRVPFLEEVLSIFAILRYHIISQARPFLLLVEHFFSSLNSGRYVFACEASHGCHTVARLLFVRNAKFCVESTTRGTLIDVPSMYSGRPRACAKLSSKVFHCPYLNGVETPVDEMVDGDIAPVLIAKSFVGEVAGIHCRKLGVVSL